MKRQDDRLQWDGIPRIVHVLAGDDRRALAAQTVIDGAAATIRRKVVPDLRVCDSRRGAMGVRRPFDGCAAILVVDDRALESPVFLGGLGELLRAFDLRRDFRVFVALDGVSNPAHPILDALKENIQLTRPMSFAAIEAPLAEYLDRLQDAKDASQWRDLSSPLAVNAGRLATAAQWLSPILVLSGFVALKWLRGGWLDAHDEMICLGVALSAGIVHFWANMLPLYFLLRGFAASSVAAAKNPWLPRWFVFGFILSAASVTLAVKASAPTPWLWLGIATGGCLDAVRRFGLQAQRVGQGVAVLSSPRRTRLTLPRPGRFGFSNPFSCRLWPDLEGSVVISYARSSQWARDAAAQLHDALAKEGASPFLDLKNIPAGANWRQELQYEIGRASTVICLLDDAAASRHWVAAELYAAMSSQIRVGTPYVIVVLHPEFQGRTEIPIFGGIMELASKPSSILAPPRIVRGSTPFVDVIAWGVAPARFRQDGVVPHKVAMKLERWLMPITAIGALAGPLGLLAWALWLVEMWNGNPVRAALGERVGLVACLTVAFVFGCASRLTILSRYRVRHDEPKTLAFVHLFSAGGLLALALAWRCTLTPLVQGWSLVAATAGWWRAGRFVAFANLGRGGGMRSH